MAIIQLCIQSSIPKIQLQFIWLNQELKRNRNRSLVSEFHSRKFQKLIQIRSKLSRCSNACFNVEAKRTERLVFIDRNKSQNPIRLYKLSMPYLADISPENKTKNHPARMLGFKLKYPDCSTIFGLS